MKKKGYHHQQRSDCERKKEIEKQIKKGNK